MKGCYYFNLIRKQGNRLPDRFQAVEYHGWGCWVEPDILPRKARPGMLRLVLLVSYPMGREILREAIHLSKSELIEIVGVATDDLIDSEAKISKTKRTWKYFSPGQQRELMLDICNLALENGIPVFTGQVKSELFRHHILPEWKPDAIVMYGFGQIVDRPIWDYPSYGMYNIHPSNLSLGEGKGADPFKEVFAEDRDVVITTIHHIDDSIDGGHIVGMDSGIKIRKKDPPYERMSILEVCDALASSADKIVRPLIQSLAQLKREGRDRQWVHSLDLSDSKNGSKDPFDI